MRRLEPAVTQPPAAVPLEGEYAPNTLLDDAQLVPVPGHGPEDVLVDDEGRVLTGIEDGSIVRVDVDAGTTEVLLDTGGRPLGLEWLPDGRLLVCNADGGLLAADLASGATEVLASEIAGTPMLIVNNAAVLDDGTIFFTDSSQRHPLSAYVLDAMEGSRTGRLLRRDPDGGLEVVLEGLGFANGVTVHPDGDSILVTGSYDHAIFRVPLAGPDAGTRQAFIEVVPGYTDNLSTGPDGTVWAPVPTRRNPIADFLLPRPALLRRPMGLVDPELLKKLVVPYSMVLGFDAAGGVLHNLQGTGAHFPMVTGAREHDGWLYLGSVRDQSRCIARVRVPGY